MTIFWIGAAVGALLNGIAAHRTGEHAEFAVMMLLAYTIYRDQVQGREE